MEIVVFIKFSSGNVIMYYITVKTMVYQLENVPTRGKLDGEARITAKTRRSTQSARRDRVDDYKAIGMFGNDLD